MLETDSATNRPRS